MAICDRMLEAQEGFPRGDRPAGLEQQRRLCRLGKPNLFFGVTAGNMDSMINRYTADRSCATMTPTPDNVAGNADRAC